MLTQGKVLNYIKGSLCFPHSELELSDEQIIEKITTNSLLEFSYYIPAVKTGVLNTGNSALLVPGRQNEFYLSEDQGLEIFNVIEVYPTSGDYWFHGHNVLGPMNFGELQDFALSTYTAMTTKMFSSFDLTFEYHHPNILRVSPINMVGGVFVYSYECMQPTDLSKIPNEFQMLFMRYALADVMITVGRIRKKFGGGQLETPFGNIQLETEIFDEGKESKREIIEKLEMGPLLNITCDFG